MFTFRRFQMPSRGVAWGRPTNHPQKRVDGIRVDARLAELLRVLWRRGYRTAASCQREGSGLAYILFLTYSQAEQFAELVKSVQKRGWPRLEYFEGAGTYYEGEGVVRFDPELIDDVTAAARTIDFAINPFAPPVRAQSDED